jgi:hypothetical protein
MRLPGGERAVVELSKLTGYCLDETHPGDGTRLGSLRLALGLREPKPACCEQHCCGRLPARRRRLKTWPIAMGDGLS